MSKEQIEKIKVVSPNGRITSGTGFYALRVGEDDMGSMNEVGITGDSSEIEELTTLLIVACIDSHIKHTEGNLTTPDRINIASRYMDRIQDNVAEKFAELEFNKFINESVEEYRRNNK